MQILATEFGDETFIVAALMAMRHPKLVVFAGALSALVIMTVISTALGYVVPNLISRQTTGLLAGCLYTFFGLRLMWIAYRAGSGSSANEVCSPHPPVVHTRPPQLPCDTPVGYYPTCVVTLPELPLRCCVDTRVGSVEAAPRRRAVVAVTTRGQRMQEEIHEVEEKLAKKNEGRWRRAARRICTPVFLEAFLLTFVAEWGDRSQIATISLAAHDDPLGVTFGAVLGHTLCTGAACLGGELLARRISPRTMAVAGGVLFFLFAAHQFWAAAAR